jgi:hypothetical protein
MLWYLGTGTALPLPLPLSLKWKGILMNVLLARGKLDKSYPKHGGDSNLVPPEYMSVVSVALSLSYLVRSLVCFRKVCKRLNFQPFPHGENAAYTCARQFHVVCTSYVGEFNLYS